MKIGIFGGTFNPPHKGHITSARAATEQLGLDLLLIVPAGLPPHKQLPEMTPPAKIRLEMSKVSFEEIQNASISDVELSTTNPSYTVQTVQKLAHGYPGSQLFLLVGTDMYLTLETWKDSKELLKYVTPAVFSRSAEDMTGIAEHSKRLHELYGATTQIVKTTVVDISSSELRRMLPERMGLRYIADTTYSYIIKNRLYGAKPDWDWLRESAYSMLNPARIPHVAGCELEAVKLAKRWSIDPDNAREAGILHDITKKNSPEENIIIFKDHGITYDKPGFAEEKLFHAQTGAILAKSMFGVSDEVAEAIRWHTTGKAGMSTLEKIIYIADYIEPERDFPGVDDLRQAAYEDLDKALKLGLEMSVSDMKARGIKPNRTTFDALNYIG